MTDHPADRPEPDTHLDGLDPRAVVIVAAVSTGATYADAGLLAGCSARTVGRTMADPTVRAAVNAERARLAAVVADTLTNSVTDAAAVLANVMHNPDAEHRDRIAAARVMLAEARAWRDSAYVESRLLAAERRAAADAARSESGRLVGLPS